jgi:hypothetical protein
MFMYKTLILNTLGYNQTCHLIHTKLHVFLMFNVIVIHLPNMNINSFYLVYDWHNGFGHSHT